MRVDTVRFETEGFLTAPARRQLTLVLKGKAQVVVRVGVVGLETEGLLILCQRCGQLALIPEGNAQVVMGVDTIRFEVNGLLIVPHCCGQLALIPGALPRLRCTSA